MEEPDLQIREGGGGGRHPDPYISGGRLKQKHFSALLALVWSKNRGAAPPAPPLDPPLKYEEKLLNLNDYYITIGAVQSDGELLEQVYG